MFCFVFKNKALQSFQSLKTFLSQSNFSLNNNFYILKKSPKRLKSQICHRRESFFNSNTKKNFQYFPLTKQTVYWHPKGVDWKEYSLLTQRNLLLPTLKKKIKKSQMNHKKFPNSFWSCAALNNLRSTKRLRYGDH